jgi:hypothetical protein
MTVETNTYPSHDVTSDWTVPSRRQGERRDTREQQSSEPADKELIFPSISPRPVWPRVFPSL